MDEFTIAMLTNQNEKLIEENNQLKEQLKGVQEEREYLFNKLSIENKYSQQENQQLHNKIDKALLQIQETYEYGDDWHWDSGTIRDYVEDIEKILKDSDVDD